MGHYISSYFRKVLRDDLLTQSAALAYYASLSVPPLIILAITAMSLLGVDWTSELIAQVKSVLGARPASAVVAVIESARTDSAYGKSGQILGLLLLLFSGSAVMAQLQVALNQVFGSARGRSAWLTIVRQRLVALAVVVVAIALTLGSIVSSVIVTTLSDPEIAKWAALAHTVLSVALFFGVFSLLFRLVPDCPPSWFACTSGSALTTVLFLAGKAPLAAVIERSAWASLYGAAGTLMLLVVWVYYSSLIICLGAELSYFVNRIARPDTTGALALWPRFTHDLSYDPSKNQRRQHRASGARVHHPPDRGVPRTDLVQKNEPRNAPDSRADSKRRGHRQASRTLSDRNRIRRPDLQAEE